MSKINYSKNSPYYLTPQTSWYRSNFVFRDIKKDGSDYVVILESKYQNRPDLLSYDYYGTTDLWWVFAIVNPDIIKDPLKDMKTGIQINIPRFDRLSRLLGAS